ncbi:hypothetical protein [Altererythrobacter fulvus]|uniref:hypothetical protein n=1 Tax=Caenibius fulvus TaxID=2126012 RepID=UPI00301A0830
MVWQNQPRCRLATRLFLGIPACVLLSISLPNGAKAQQDVPTEVFSIILQDMNAPRRLQFCGYVAQEAASQARETADVALRSARYASAQTLQSRLATGVADANAKLSREQLETIQRENGVALGLLTYEPSSQLAAQIEQHGTNDVIGLFLSDLVAQCDGLLDSMGVAAAPPNPARSSPIPMSFEWRGKTAEEAFEGTGLAPYALRICAGTESKVSDFAGANLAERGKDGVSLLDWAFECGDKSAFKALLDAGFDAAKPGQFDDPPLVNAAGHDDSWYLRELLAYGVSPDSMGHRSTALAEAYQPGEPGGGGNFEILRAAGASLNFPNPGRSMWGTWAIFASWEEILENWDAFDSDPFYLGRFITLELEKPNVRGSKQALEEVRDRLIVDFGVCFPVSLHKDTMRDARGYYLQTNCSEQGQPDRTDGP